MDFVDLRKCLQYFRVGQKSKEFSWIRIIIIGSKSLLINKQIINSDPDSANKFDSL